MIDKSKRTATAERYGSMIAIHMKGGPDCLWLNMYLDMKDWQMTCDSDIGFYAYRWGAPRNSPQTFLNFCIDWLSNEEWLLRKCIGEKHAELDFDVEKTKQDIIRAFLDENGEDCDIDIFMDALEVADGYSRDSGEWAAALTVACNHLRVELPEEWWTCLVKDYTPWQKRFAEICREVIVPELMKLAIEELTAVRRPHK